jgi:NADPH-dependent 7-cyano-7-deazaguanine reductase QueF-like protein
MLLLSLVLTCYCLCSQILTEMGELRRHMVADLSACQSATYLLLLSLLLTCFLLCSQILTEMGELRRHVEGDLSACQSALDEEAQADAAARSQYGDEWRMPTSATLGKHYWEKLHSYRLVV